MYCLNHFLHMDSINFNVALKESYDISKPHFFCVQVKPLGNVEEGQGS